MESKPGRKPLVPREQLTEIMIRHKNEVITDDNKVSNKRHGVWEKIAAELENKITPLTLYAIVTNNKYNIRTLVSPKVNDSLNSTSDSKRSGDSTLDSSKGLLNASENSQVGDDGRYHFQFSMTYDELDSLIISVSYRKRKGDAKTLKKQAFKPFEWETVITDKIWHATHRKCGYNFKNHYITANKMSGSINGHCDCGSLLHAKFQVANNEAIFTCNATRGTGQCSKIYLRKSHRKIAAEKMKTLTTDQYEAEFAREKCMNKNDPLPPHMPKASVLRSAKAELVRSEYYHPDPITAISIMHDRVYPGTIHFLSIIPFTVCYWTHHQRDVFIKYAANEKSCVFIDATGGVSPKFTKQNQVRTSQLLLYLIAINYCGQQFTVGQMISESQDATVITHFWEKWLKYGFPKPCEVVMDNNEAQLIATISAFTGFKTVRDYANACRRDIVPSCYIRIDVAHFMHLYAKQLSTSSKLVKTFYLACLGQLLCMIDEKQIWEYLKLILTVALSERAGKLPSGLDSPCQVAKDKLRNSIIGNKDEFDNVENDEKYGDLNDINEDDEDNNDTEWSELGKKLHDDVVNSLNDHGIEENALYNEELVKKLLRDIKKISLWSSISYKKFNTGRIPASSAPVESEVARLKRGIFKKNKGLRVDAAVEAHIKYLLGRTSVVDANIEEQLAVKNKTSNNEDFNAADYNNQDDDVCPACKDGNLPSGNHTCIKCHKAVHTLEQCSTTVHGEEEGFSQKRLCRTCNLASKHETKTQEAEENNKGQEKFDFDHDNGDNSDGNNATNQESSYKVKDDSDCHSYEECVRCCKSIKNEEAHSVDDSDDTFSSYKVCSQCIKIDKQSTKEMLGKRTFENWRGQGEPVPQKKSRSLYIGDKSKNIIEMLNYEKARGLPILKNGHSKDLTAVNIGNRSISLYNTCPFDSIFQLLLVAACDFPTINEKMAEEVNEMFQLVYKSLKGINSGTYRERARMMLEHFNVLRSIQNIDEISCEAQVASFAGKLFKDTPSFEETLNCSKECMLRVITQVVLPVREDAFNSFEHVFEDHILRKYRCNNIGCTQFTMRDNMKISDLVFFEPYAENGAAVRKQLKAIPIRFTRPTDSKAMKLVGIVHYYPPTVSRTRTEGIKSMKLQQKGMKTKKNNSNKENSAEEVEWKPVGHYVAICKRRNGSWVMYDDQKSKEREVRENLEVQIALMLYVLEQ